MWSQVTKDSNKITPADSKLAKEWEIEKQISSGEIQKESENSKGFKPIRFQDFRAIGLFEGEFGEKGRDVIFHFWPDKFHENSRTNKSSTPLSKTFLTALDKATTEAIGKGRFEVVEDKDMGAVFMKIHGLKDDIFWKERCVELCKSLYLLLGGTL